MLRAHGILVLALALMAGTSIAATPNGGRTQSAPKAPPAAAPAAAAPAAAAPAPRTITYTMEQLRTGPLSPEIQQRMTPMNTIQEVEALLKANRIEFAWRMVEVANTALPPDLARQIAAMKPTDVYFIPSPNGALIGAIVSQR
jgi:hypothetical protein